MSDKSILSGLIRHVKRWNKWRKHNRNSRFYKLLVLLGVVKSPTFMLVFLDEERDNTNEP